MTRIGDAIRQTRVEHGMTAKDLAVAVGLSQQFVSDVERGYRVPSVETVLRIGNAFPDADSASWLWLVIRSQHGDAIADLLWRHAVAVAVGGDPR